MSHGYLHSVVPSIPLWLDEGLAECSEVPRARNGMNTSHYALLTKKLREGWRPDLARLESLSSAAEMTQLEYAESWAWAHFLLKTTPQRRWLLAVVLGVLAAAGAGAAVWFLLPANYQVFAQLQIASSQQSLVSSQNRAEGRGDFSTFLKTQMDRIRSRYVITAALKRDEVKRLKAVELAVMDDPLARDPNGAPGRRSRIENPEASWPQAKPPGRRPGSSGGKPGTRAFRKKRQ